jgi:hypothetical protein
MLEQYRKALEIPANHKGHFPLHTTQHEDFYVITTNQGNHFAKTFDPSSARLISAAPDLLAICEEIANDSRCDLVNSERRIRLYSAISKAKGEAL